MRSLDHAVAAAASLISSICFANSRIIFRQKRTEKIFEDYESVWDSCAVDAISQNQSISKFPIIVNF